MSGRLTGWLALVVFLAAISYAGRLSGGKPPADVLYRYESAIFAAVQYGLMLAVLLWIAKGLPWREAFALRAPPSWKAALGRSAAALVAIFVGAGILLTALGATDEQGLTPDAWDPERAGAYAANFVAVAVIAPVVEELAYRGLGFTLISPFGAVVAGAVTAVAFAAAHGLVLAFPALVLFGAVNAWLRVSTGSILPPILVHMAFNAISLTVSVTV